MATRTSCEKGVEIESQGLIVELAAELPGAKSDYGQAGGMPNVVGAEDRAAQSSAETDSN